MLSDFEFVRLVEEASNLQNRRSGDGFGQSKSGGNRSNCNKGRHVVSLRDQNDLPAWAEEMREMLQGLLRFRASRHGRGFDRIYAPAIDYAWEKLKATDSAGLLAVLPSSARKELEKELRKALSGTARPCLKLQLSAYRAVTRGLFISVQTLRSLETTPFVERFLGNDVIERLFELFKAFPVLPRLWSQIIADWCVRTEELLIRLTRDRILLARALFNGKSPGRLLDLHTGLSDPHNGGRSVVLLKFDAGQVIYKPRSGAGELEWFALLQWMNLRGFVPKFRTVKVLNRGNYCWMEYVSCVACKNAAAVRRFYRRAGGMLCAARVFQAVDCHRDNIIAFGEHPVLIDAEAFLHVEDSLDGTASSNALLQTGFLPDRHSQCNSHVLGGSDLGPHMPRFKDQWVSSFKHTAELIWGFRTAWRILLGNRTNRAKVHRRIQRLGKYKWRRIYRTTRTYAAARQAGMQPAALRSGTVRSATLHALVTKQRATSSIIAREVAALERQDIPYFRIITKVRSQLPNVEDLGVAVTQIRDALSS